MHELIDYIHQLMPDVIMPDGIVQGGLISWVTGLKFSVSAVIYWLQNVLHKVLGKEVTLDPGDATYDRRDVIAVTDNWEIVVVKGTPGPGAMKPTVDRRTMIELTDVLVPANATEPAGITNDLVFDENQEWTPQASGVIVNFNSATDPYTGLKCADVGSIGTGDRIVFTASSPLLVAEYETLSGFLKLKAAMNKQHTLLAEFLLAGVPVSNAIPILSTSVVLTWQSLALKLADFSFTGTEFDAICFRWTKSGQQADHAGFYLDYVKLEKGIQQPPTADDSYVDKLYFDEATNEIVLEQTNNRPSFRVLLPDGGGGGTDGREVELSVVGDYIVWRYVGEANWINLVALSVLEGPPGEPGEDGAPGAPGQDGEPGAPGSDGREIELRENAGWVEWRYVGDVNWIQLYQIPTGGGGGGSEAPELHLDFEEAGDEYVYNIPYAIKFTSMVCEGTAATLSHALNTDLPRYTKLTVTANAAGLVSLYGQYL